MAGFLMDTSAATSSDAGETTDSLPDTKMLIKVARSVGDEWYLLGRLFEFEDDTLNQLENENQSRGGTHTSYKLLELWKKKKGRKATAKSLSKHLADMDLTDCAEEIFQVTDNSELAKNAISQQSEVTQQSVNYSSSCEQFSKNDSHTITTKDSLHVLGAVGHIEGDVTIHEHKEKNKQILSVRQNRWTPTRTRITGPQLNLPTARGPTGTKEQQGNQLTAKMRKGAKDQLRNNPTTKTPTGITKNQQANQPTAKRSAGATKDKQGNQPTAKRATGAKDQQRNNKAGRPTGTTNQQGNQPTPKSSIGAKVQQRNNTTANRPTGAITKQKSNQPTARKATVATNQQRNKPKSKQTGTTNQQGNKPTANRLKGTSGQHPNRSTGRKTQQPKRQTRQVK